MFDHPLLVVRICYTIVVGLVYIITAAFSFAPENDSEKKVAHVYVFFYWLVTIFWTILCHSSLESGGMSHIKWFWRLWFGSDVVGFLVGFVVLAPWLIVSFVFLYYFIPGCVCGYIDELKRQWGGTSKQKPK